MTRWIETDDLSDQDISSALAIGSYTADADRSILCQFFADQVAGDGDYIFYLTLQIAGAGSAYVMLPKTTGAAAAGETALGGQSIIVNVRSGDVVTAYLDGLAGDTTTPDTSVRWFELAALRPTTADRTLDVSAGGEAGVDWANVGSPTTAVELSGTTVKAVTDAEADIATLDGKVVAVDTVVDAIQAKTDNLPADPASETNVNANETKIDTLDTVADAIKAKTDNLPADPASETNVNANETKIDVIDGNVDAILADTGADGVKVSEIKASALADMFNTDSGDNYAGSVAGSVVKEIVDNAGGASLTPASIWAYATRTLTQAAASVVAAVSGSSINIQRGDTLSAALTGLGSLSGYVSIDFTVKEKMSDTDDEAILRIRKNASGIGDGLLRVNGAAASQASDGSITIDDADAGDITIALAESVSDDLEVRSSMYYDVQLITASAVSTLSEGYCNVNADVTRAVS